MNDETRALVGLVLENMELRKENARLQEIVDGIEKSKVPTAARGDTQVNLSGLPGVHGLTMGDEWQLRIERDVTLQSVRPLLEQAIAANPRLPQHWTANSQDHCFYGRDPSPDEAGGVYRV